MCFNVDVLATEDVGMVLDVSVEVHVDTAAVGVVELAIGMVFPQNQENMTINAHAGTHAVFLAVCHH